MKLVAAFLAGASLATALSARADFMSSYSVTLTTGQPVTNIMMLEEGSDWGSSTWSFQASGSGTTELDNPFPQSSPVLDALLVGIVQDLPGDAPGQKHVVLFMDNTAASLGENIAWGTLFRNTDEDQLIANIELATSGQDWSIIQPGLDAVGAFSQGDAKTGILNGLAQPQTAWMTAGGTFAVETWSDGTIIGSGTSTVTSVPEPMLLGLAGMSGLVLMRRRSKGQ